jgi:hypothetical protein
VTLRLWSVATTAATVIGVIAFAGWPRVVWHWRPSLKTCLLFWLWVLLLRVAVWHPSMAAAVSGVGLLLNAAVTLLNRGYMPVMDGSVTGNIWVEATPRHRLLWLCDRFGPAWAKFSVGDFLIFGGIALSFWRPK